MKNPFDSPAVTVVMGFILTGILIFIDRTLFTNSGVPVTQNALPPMEEMSFRWLHIMAGVMWVGLLWYFNFIQVPFLKLATTETKAEAFRNLVPRALLFFRMAAYTTWLLGVLWLLRRGILVDAFAMRGTAAIIGTGAWLGTIMAFNVAFIIWPNQKKVIGLVEADTDTKTAAARSALLASRFNLMLSIPLIFFMGASTHGQGIFVSVP